MDAAHRMQVIGLVGHAGSGKDTVARHLVRKYCFQRRALADPLRLLVQRTYALPVRGEYQSDEWLQEWDDLKRGSAWVRRVLQDIGVSCRELLGPDVWMNALRHSLEPWVLKLVIPDIRFHNELEWLRESNGILMAIERPGVTAVNAHQAECAIDDLKRLADITLLNDKDETALFQAVDGYL